MSAAAALDALKDQFKMTWHKKRDVNPTLYAAAAYGIVSGSQPPQWFVRGSPRTAGRGRGRLQDPYSLLCDIPQLGVVPNGEFRGGSVVVAGEATVATATVEAVKLLVHKGAGRLRCLVGQAAGGAAVDAAAKAAVETTSIGHAGEDLRRSA